MAEIIFFILFFYKWIDVGWHLECISTLQEWHLTRFSQNNDPPYIKNYINKLESKNRVFK